MMRAAVNAATPTIDVPAENRLTEDKLQALYSLRSHRGVKPKNHMGKATRRGRTRILRLNTNLGIITVWIRRYNATRLHSSLGYVSPIEWEMKYAQMWEAA